MNKIYRREIGLYSFLDYLDISINHCEVLCCFIKILLEYKRNSFPKIFFLEIFKSGSTSDPVLKKNFKSESAPDHPRKIAGYPIRIRSVPISNSNLSCSYRYSSEPVYVLKEQRCSMTSFPGFRRFFSTPQFTKHVEDIHLQ